MRILSKFKDYYDSMAVYGVDTTLVYDRKTYILRLPEGKFRSWQKDIEYKEQMPLLLRYAYGNASFFRNILFVGGQFYTYFHAIVYKEKLRRNSLNIRHEQLIFNEAELTEFGETYLDSSFFNGSRERLYSDNFIQLSELFVTTPKVVKELAGKEPLWVLYGSNEGLSIKYNPCLKTIGFSKYVSPSKIHQLISMWLASNKEPPAIPEIDDLTMSRAKGFDKFSFRKDKSR